MEEMIQMSTTTVSALDDLLRPYEARPLGIARDEAAERQRGAAVSSDMHQALGFAPNVASDRLIRLWCLGQVTEEELDALVLEVAKRGLYEPWNNETIRDGR